MNLKKYPNLRAILNGTVAGSFRDWLAVRPELEKLVVRVDELETALKLVQQWGADARSADSYEVFEAVRLSLIDLPASKVKVVDCTCLECICPGENKQTCLGCGARTCLAHELALKTSSRPLPPTKSPGDPE